MRKITVNEVSRTCGGGVQLIYRCDCKMKRHIHGGGCTYEEFERKLEETPEKVSFGTRVSHCVKHTKPYELIYSKN